MIRLPAFRLNRVYVVQAGLGPLPLAVVRDEALVGREVGETPRGGTHSPVSIETRKVRSPGVTGDLMTSARE